MKIFLTGLPRSGKSTILEKIIDLLKQKGIRVGGFITPEIREKNRRTGFYVKDVCSGEMEVFASIDFKIGPRLGSYGVDVECFDKIALKALEFAVNSCEIVCIDEIGKLEFFSKRFREELTKIMLIDKPIIAVLHRNFVNQFKDYGKVIEVNAANREKLPEEIMKIIFS